MTPANLPGLTVTVEQLGPIWTPIRGERPSRLPVIAAATTPGRRKH